VARWARRGRAGAAEEAVADATGVSDVGERMPPVVEVDPVRAEQLAAFRRACAAREEAIRDLQRLRERHWSGERLIEESRVTMEWWEHPEADPYAVLGLLPGASLEEAGAARRKIAAQCHPDRHAGDRDSMELRRMVAANAAYDRLRRALIRV
jgi:hypothetical protein